VLICGKTTLAKTTDIFLHVVCEYADSLYIEFVTAYIPDEQEWENPPVRRRYPKEVISYGNQTSSYVWGTPLAEGVASSHL